MSSEIEKLQKGLNNIKLALNLGVKGGIFSSLDEPTQLMIDLQNIIKYIDDQKKEIESLKSTRVAS